MRLFVDLDLGIFTLAAGTNQPETGITVKRGPAAEIEIQFLRGVTPQELPSDASGIFEVKTAGEFDSSPLTAALAWVKTGTGVDTIYTFTLPLVNDPLDALLGIDPLHDFTVVAATDLFTSASHGLVANDIIQSSSTVALPAPLLPNTDYHVIASGLTADDFKVSLTSGGAAVNITDTGTGIHSFRRTTNDIESVTLMAAMQWVADGRTNETQTINFILENDVVREGEIPPAFPPLVYAVFMPEVSSMADFKAVPTVGMSLGYLTEILIDVSGTTTLLKYRLVSGPATEAEPEHVEPNDYDLGTNDVHWEGAAGPSGPPGVHAGIPYKWNTSTAATDPTTGKVKVNHATLASATELYISEVDDDGNALAALLATWDDSTSTIRGRLLLQDPDDPANFAIFNITGTLTDNGTWDTFTIAHVSSGGTLTNNLPLRAFFIPKGDKGDSGDAGFKYQFNSATSGDPATGKFLFNHATFLSATVFHISETDGDANALATFLASVDDGTSTNKCLVIAQKQGGVGFFAFYITAALTDIGAYDIFPITPIASGGAIANGDTLFLSFLRVGDIGSTGATGSTGTPPAITQNYSTTTTDSDPGSGIFRFNNATIASVTAGYFDNNEAGGSSITAWLDSFDDSTSANKGVLIVRGVTNPLAFAIFAVSGTVVDGTGYRKLTLGFLASGGTFTNTDLFAINFFRTGDLASTAPQNAQPNDYTFVLGDAGKHIFHDHATPHTYTIPANGSVAYPLGTIITVANNNGAGDITLAITTDTLRRGDGTAGTGSRTITADSVVSILKTKTTEWMITGKFS